MFRRLIGGIALLLLANMPAAAQRKKILVTGLSAEAVAELQAASPGATIVGVQANELLHQVSDADAIIGTINPELVRAGKKLQWVQIGSAGVERYLHLSSPELRDSRITLTNGKIIQGPEIADHAFALLLTLTRGTNRFLKEQSQEEWSRGRYPLIELKDKTAVILGVGGIGSQIAVRATAFGMNVIGVDPKDIPFAPFLDRVVRPDRLDSVLPEADVVFVAAPHTPESDQMMGSRQFDLMKKDSYFVAVSRGRLYSMDALVRALDSRKLAGAGVDVTDPEPLPKGHPLWKFDNVVITPHAAGGSDGIGGRRIALFKENIRRFVAGEPLLNVVDKQKGY
ncbi:MAG: D-2-hydroxyacid dehydrogenase [Bryobacteraceae bacterium]|nr:D-2-hydroxyacid dehydrogenase [Bryobacteraceae bacterium]